MGGADAKKGGAGGSYTWGGVMDVPTDYSPVGYSQQSVTIAAAPQLVQTATAAAPMTVNIADTSAFPILGATPAPAVQVQGWGAGSQGVVVVAGSQVATAQTVAPIRQTVEFGAQHPRNTFARPARTSTGGYTLAPQPAAIDWSAPGTTGMQQAVIQQSGNPAHLGPYQIAQPAVAQMPLNVLKQQQPVYQPPAKVVSKPKVYTQQKVTQPRGR